jgi:hypothetical protein
VVGLGFVVSYLPASDTEKESEDIGLLLLLKLFNVFEGTHLREKSVFDSVETGKT